MLKDILRRLGAPEPDPAPLSADDGRLALSALLVRLARSDEDYTETERRMIERVLAGHLEIGTSDARALREEAETLEAQASDTVQFTRLIKAAVPYEDRASVVEALWQLAVTDGIDAEEQGFMRLVANLLGVSDVDSGLARQRALRERR